MRQRVSGRPRLLGSPPHIVMASVTYKLGLNKKAMDVNTYAYELSPAHATPLRRRGGGAISALIVLAPLATTLSTHRMLSPPHRCLP